MARKKQEPRSKSTTGDARTGEQSQRGKRPGAAASVRETGREARPDRPARTSTGVGEWKEVPSGGRGEARTSRAERGARQRGPLPGRGPGAAATGGRQARSRPTTGRQERATRASTSENPAGGGGVEPYLAGVDFPARLEEIIRGAERNDAPREVLKELRNLPDRRFSDRREVVMAYAGGGTARASGARGGDTGSVPGRGRRT